MADMPPFSSQSSQYEANKISLEQENFNSSPLRPRSTIQSSQKPRKPPTVTPKRFNKFFTPRSTLSSQRGRQSKAGRQLRDITRNGVNRRRAGEVLPDEFARIEKDVSSRPPKRQKLVLDLESSPPQSSPLKRVQFAGLETGHDDRLPSPTLSDMESLPDLLRDCQPFPKPVRRIAQNGVSRRLLNRSFGGYDTTSRGRRPADHAVSPRTETAGFTSVPEDCHQFNGGALPFCTASCHTNTLVAIGDEEGSVRLVDTAVEAPFSQAHVNFRVHNNALMDLAFSPDDYILASASGDQTTRLVDMHTQQTVCILAGHKSSVKQVRFNPADENMITTSSRDGTVQIWDMRCTGNSVFSIRAACRGIMDGDGNVGPETRYSTSKLDVGFGHRSTTRPYVDDMRSDLSITAIQHMPHGREHILLTASEVNASIKLWDIRNASRRNTIALSSTEVPSTHRHTRHYGINSMVLSGDGARLYAVCRDATVYAYSTNQLALGYVPELSAGPSRRRMLRESKPGLGPLYALRHPNLRVGSFYVKAAIRHARDDKSELLAVGSTDHTPILFPTDERHFPLAEHSHPSPDDDDDEYDALPTFSLTNSRPASPANSTANRQQNSVQQRCYTDVGTPLVRAHTKEVTSVVWSHRGELVSVSDDFTARCWRERPDHARVLRTAGESGGIRWNAGWADVPESEGWDDEDW